MHTTIFERLIAMTRDRGNLGYLMYLADAFGYLGYVAVMLAHNVLGGPANFSQLFPHDQRRDRRGVLAVAWRVLAVFRDAPGDSGPSRKRKRRITLTVAYASGSED